MIAYAKFNGFLTVGYFLNGKFCYCHLVEYSTMPLSFVSKLSARLTIYS